MKKACQQTTDSIDWIAPWRETTYWLFILHEPLKHALDRGIVVRCLSKGHKVMSLTKTINDELSKF